MGSPAIYFLIQVLKRLKKEDDNLTVAYIRTDNAGCYKGSDLFLAVELIYKETGILIRRFDFSDAQSGKGPCDRMAAVIKANIRRFICEMNDCITSSNFVDAAKSTRFMTIMSCRLSDSTLAKKSRWPGIQNFNNLQYDLSLNESNSRSKLADSEIKVTVWRAFQIGSGQTFNWSQFNTSIGTIAPLQIDFEHNNSNWRIDPILKGKIVYVFDIINFLSVFIQIILMMDIQRMKMKLI